MLKPIETKCWERFLSHHGFDCVRTKGSHDQWVKKGHRTIPVWGNKKQIPGFHVKKCCPSVGANITIEDFYIWSKDNC